jgi:hypothetical protein
VYAPPTNEGADKFLAGDGTYKDVQDTQLLNNSTTLGLNGLTTQKDVNEHLVAMVHIGTTAPANPYAGQFWFNTTPEVKNMYFYDGDNWIGINTYQ